MVEGLGLRRKPEIRVAVSQRQRQIEADAAALIAALAAIRFDPPRLIFAPRDDLVDRLRLFTAGLLMTCAELQVRDPQLAELTEAAAEALCAVRAALAAQTPE